MRRGVIHIAIDAKKNFSTTPDIDSPSSAAAAADGLDLSLRTYTKTRIENKDQIANLSLNFRKSSAF